MRTAIEAMNPQTIPLTSIVFGSPAIISPRSSRAMAPSVRQKQLTASSEKTMKMTRESLEGTKAMAEALNQILAQVQNLQAITESKE